MPETILVVDQDREARAAKAALNERRYRVLTAGDGEQALEILGSEGDVDLVATAALLPGELSGIALIGRIRLQYPATAVMLMTSRARTSADAGIARLAKPFTAAALVERVDQLISEQRTIASALATAFEWNRAAKSELESVRESLRENIRQSRQQRAERFCARLREPGATIPTVLLAEDNRATRYAVRRYLEGRGFRVVDAPDGADALTLSRSGRVDVLLTDFSMPGLNGMELASAVAAEQPGVRVILMTGDDVRVPHCTLRKPFEFEDLLTAIVSLLIRC